MADEWMQVVDRLWQSWEPGAIVADLETGVFAGHTEIHPIHFEGRFYRSRGPLNTAPGHLRAYGTAQPRRRGLQGDVLRLRHHWRYGGGACEKRTRITTGLANTMDTKLAGMSYPSGIDCAKFDLDAPLPKLTINASRASFEATASIS
jgi:hypothetical protein